MGDSSRPWVAGMRIKGELAAQYRMEESLPSQGGPDDEISLPSLILQYLAPINIFVGANNTGKSRLMRELFWRPQAICSLQLRAGIDGELVPMDSLHSLLLEAVEADPQNSPLQLRVNDSHTRASDSGHDTHWFSIDQVELLHSIYGSFEAEVKKVQPTIRAPLANPSIWTNHDEGVDQHRSLSAKYDKLNSWTSSFDNLDEQTKRVITHLRSFKSATRCYVPMLRGMRPLANLAFRDRSDGSKSDQYQERTIYDYFRVQGPSVNSTDEAKSDEFLGVMSSNVEVDPQSKWSNPIIFTGLSLYDDLQRRLLAPTQHMRQSVRKYEEFLSANFFPGLEVTLTPALENRKGGQNDVVHIKIGDNEDRPIYELGDGMQGLIICTYPIITEENEGALFFLEEPDIGMHPSLQRVFLDVLKKYALTMNHQFFLTTHSNHMLDLIEDSNCASIFSFSQVDAVSRSVYLGADQNPSSAMTNAPMFQIRPALIGDRSVLAALGVRPSATYLANATIWVEGVTDCNYIRAYMDAFRSYLGKSSNSNARKLAGMLNCYKEDRHYSFVEYNGANIVHFDFSDDLSSVEEVCSLPGPGDSKVRPPILCGNAIVIFDGDNNEKINRVDSFAKQLGDRLLVLPGKEVENLIPESALKSQLKEDNDNQRLKIKWPDDFNQRLDTIKYSDYARKRCEDDSRSRLCGIGSYLDGLGISGYADSGRESDASGSIGLGTLNGRHKLRWAKPNQGIPLKIRNLSGCNELHPPDESNPAFACSGLSTDGIGDRLLPPYITHDIIFLCTCIYAHIADSSHDDVAVRLLADLKKVIINFHSCGSPAGGPGNSDSTAENGTVESPASRWPIGTNTFGSRDCLFGDLQGSTPV